MIRYANISDLDTLSKYDKHISKDELANAINLNRIIVMYENDKFIGWLRYNLFWDNIPFLNMLYFLDEERGKGNGSKLIKYWEDEMKKQGFEAVLTYTQNKRNKGISYFSFFTEKFANYLGEKVTKEKSMENAII